MSEDYTFKSLEKKEAKPSKILETFSAPHGCSHVTMTSNEVTALCPVTGQPDWYTVTIEYEPDKLCIESKSLKLYLWSFREEGHFCETLAGIINNDIVKTISPKECKVTLIQKSRGGISITAVSDFSEK